MGRAAEAEQERPAVQHQDANNLTIVAKANWEVCRSWPVSASVVRNARLFARI
jgi:hypothetical protein